MELLGTLTMGLMKWREKEPWDLTRNDKSKGTLSIFRLGWQTKRVLSVRQVLDRKVGRGWLESLGWVVLSWQKARGSRSTTLMDESGKSKTPLGIVPASFPSL